MLRSFSARLAQHTARTARRKSKPEGDISSVFGSLSKDAPKPLPERFADIKTHIVGSQLQAISESWNDLLYNLKGEIEVIDEQGTAIVPIIDFNDISRATVSPSFIDLVRHRGVCIVRNVLEPSEALSLKSDAVQYIKMNPNTKGVRIMHVKPPSSQNHRPENVRNPDWSPSQVRARADPRMLSVQRFFVGLWHKNGKPLSAAPLTYADRFRIRRPGDARFALGPHVDGGSVERWEDPTYRASYQAIFDGRWRDFDPFDIATRGEANMNLYDTAGGCSVFRAWQGWLSMSDTGPTEGTLRVLPLTKVSTAYWLLRPFFSPPPASHADAPWVPDVEQLYLHGANPGRGQELSEVLHPHLELGRSVISIPRVAPGDVVMWHGDLIHAVESKHSGKGDSAVMYIPAAPSTPSNIEYVEAQRQAFLDGIPPPDFPGGIGESAHIGRATRDLIDTVGNDEALRAMGF